jgi:uncharacterized membrane protein
LLLLHQACLTRQQTLLLLPVDLPGFRDWEFSWLARNLAPIKNQKLHWVSEPGSASLGLNINNSGQIRWVTTLDSSCRRVKKHP